MRSLFPAKAIHINLPESEYPNHFYWVFLGIASLSIFLFDLLTPLGIAAGVPYALIVFTSLWFRNHQTTYTATATGILLTLIGFFLSPGAVAPIDAILTNRILALIVITITAYMVLKIKKANNELSTLMAESYVDPLTHCKNNHAFEEETKTEITRSQRYKRNLSLAVFEINQSSGHLEGVDGSANAINECSIKLLSDEIRKSIRSSDQLYRIDRNRFAVTYVETDIGKAQDASEALCKNVSIPHQQELQSGIKVCAGITMLNDKDNFWKLSQRAEDALLKAKNTGSNNVASLPETTRNDKSNIPAILSRPRSG